MLSDRINIQYSIDVEEFPSEIKRLLAKAQEHVNALHDAALPALMQTEDKSILSLNTLEEIDIVRRRLAAIDYGLSDVDHILTAYLEFKVKGQPEAETAPDPVADEEPQEHPANMLFNDLSALQEKVDELNDAKV
jgi:hypothetical protein